MKSAKILIAVAVILVPVCSGAVEHLSLADATPGRTGICVTEMDGGERVEIPLTVLGTIGSGTPNGEIVLVRLDDPRFEKTGIIAGMSGSPVYLDGRLLGALAYGWPFSKDPIGGVTPFERMLEVEAASFPATAAGRPQFVELLASSIEGDLGERLVDWLLPGTSPGLRPLPLTVSFAGGAGLSGGTWLDEGWRRMGWLAAAGGSATAGAASSEIKPGSMVAAVLVDGDLSIAAAGTVTEVQGDRLWAFGHSSFGAGGVELPLARAGVVAVMPSLMSSFKFFSVGEIIGAMVADRAPGVVGQLDRVAPMIPFRVTVNERAYSFRVARHPTLLPFLAAYLTQSSHGAFGRALGDQSIDLRMELRYPDDRAAVSASFAGNQAPSQAAAYTAAVVAYLENSAFETPEVEEISIELSVHEELRSARILEIVPDRRVVRPGDELAVGFRLQPHRGSEIVKTLKLKVPDSAPAGRLDLVGADGAAWTAYDLQMRPLLTADFQDEIELVNRLEAANSLVAVFERQDLGITVAGGSISAPPSVVMQLRSALGPNLETTAYSVIAKTTVEMPFVVSGAQRISLTVRKD